MPKKKNYTQQRLKTAERLEKTGFTKVAEVIRQRVAAPHVPEIIYLRQLRDRELRHSQDPEQLAAEAEYRDEPRRGC